MFRRNQPIMVLIILVIYGIGVIGNPKTAISQNDRIEITALNLVVNENSSPALKYAINQLTEFCRLSAKIEIRIDQQINSSTGTLVLIGRPAAEQYAPSVFHQINWNSLGTEGFVLRWADPVKTSILIAAGADDRGTRHAVYTLLRELDVSRLPATLSRSLNLIERPDFNLRGMYAHQHWAYHYPYALRTWSVEEWKKYVDILALLRVNLFQIWSMAGILPVPLSSEDEAFLRRYPPVIDHARQNHGMEAWIGECANNVCDRHDVPPITERDYFAVETLKNPADPLQMDQLQSARAEFYKICNNADGYWVIDSDPGKWPGSPVSEFVDILMMNRRLINQCTRLSSRAKLIYWMWMGWGTEDRQTNWRNTLIDLKQRSPEPWWMTVAYKEHWKVVNELGLTDRVVYYPYGAVEPEPSLPFTTVVPPILKQAMDIPDRVGKIRGAMGNAQTPICQLPNLYYFTRAVWNLNSRNDSPESIIRELARLIYPEHADILAQAWLSLGNPDVPQGEELSNELEKLERDHQLGRPGPIGFKLFPDYGQIARDLAAQLRIQGSAMKFCKMANQNNIEKRQLFNELKRYCLLSLVWRRHTGFRNYAVNDCNFAAVHQAVHKRLWIDNRLDPNIQSDLKEFLHTQFDDWEIKLILKPLSR